VLFCNDARRIHFSIRRRLENSLRERFGFGGAPMRLTFRSRREPAARS
jgi:GTP-binding protein